MGIGAWFQRLIEKIRKRFARKKRKVFFEPLEPRILLSAETLSVTAGTDGPTDLKLLLDNTSQDLQVIDSIDQAILESQPEAETSSVEISGSDGDDTLIVDMSTPISAPVSFDGGEGSDSQVIEGGSFDEAIHNLEEPGSGSVALDSTVISYTDIETVSENSIVGERSFIGTDTDDTFSLNDDSDPANSQSQLEIGDTSTAIEKLTFSNPEDSLFVDMAGGDDTITLGAFDDGFTAETTIDGNTGDDTLIAVDPDNVWNIEGKGEGDVNGVSFVGFESLTGGAGEDIFIFSDPQGEVGVAPDDTSEFHFDAGEGIDTLDLGTVTTDLTTDFRAALTVIAI